MKIMKVAMEKAQLFISVYFIYLLALVFLAPRMRRFHLQGSGGDSPPGGIQLLVVDLAVAMACNGMQWQHLHLAFTRSFSGKKRDQ